jgi:hypothetical protein
VLRSRYSCQILMELKLTLQIFLYCSNINFHEGSSSGSRDFPCGETGGRTGKTKETVAFHSLANMPYSLQIRVMLEDLWVRYLYGMTTPLCVTCLMGNGEPKIMLRKVFEKEVCSEMKNLMIINNKNNPKRVVSYSLF